MDAAALACHRLRHTPRPVGEAAGATTVPTPACPLTDILSNGFTRAGRWGSYRSFTRVPDMHDASSLWTILVLFLLVAALIGGLSPTLPLSVAATAVFALGFLLLVLVKLPEISLDLAQLVFAIAVFVGALAHLVRRVARAWWRDRSKLRQYLRIHSLASWARPPKRHRTGQDR